MVTFVNQLNMVVTQVSAKDLHMAHTNSLMEYSLQVDHVIYIIHAYVVYCVT